MTPRQQLLLNQVEEMHSILSLETDQQALAKCAKIALRVAKANGPGTMELNPENVKIVLNKWIRHLLDCELYEGAARVLWGPDIFRTEPHSVQLIWSHLPTCSDVVIMGCGAAGKSFSIAVHQCLDFLRDPEWTCIKVLSVTKEHALRNVFAHIKNLFNSARIPLSVSVKGGSIQVNEDEKQGIHLVAIPAGEDGKGRLRGFHPVPRSKPHPKFGTLSRIRVLLDEAEEIPGGVWEDVNNIRITRDGVEHVKIFAASNPKDRNSKFGQLCEPEEGWDSQSIDGGETWRGRLGWNVIRLDGARCENVVQRKVVFPGLLTWEGYQQYLKLGDTSPEYFTMARGWFPEQGLAVAVIPQDYIARARGSFVFQGGSTYCAGVDLAFEGEDKAVMTIGRFGRVLGADGKPFTDGRINVGLQIESQFELTKGDTLFMTQNIMKICKNLFIKPEWLVCDRTGNGTGVHDMLRSMFGQDVMGLHFGTAATHTKILKDDSLYADEMYDGVVTELLFGLRKYIEFGYLKLSPSLDMAKLGGEMSGRRYKQSKGDLVRVESKKEFKARGHSSPDRLDSLSLLCHLVRMRSEILPTMLAQMETHRDHDQTGGVVDKLDFITFDEE